MYVCMYVFKLQKVYEFPKEKQCRLVGNLNSYTEDKRFGD